MTRYVHSKLLLVVLAVAIAANATHDRATALQAEASSLSRSVLRDTAAPFAACGWKVQTAAASPQTFLTGVSADGINDIWAVGSMLPEVSPTAPVVEHFNGVAWSTTSAVGVNNAVTEFTSVSALAPNRVWAAGSVLFPGHILRSISQHWDGVRWTLVPTVNPVQGLDYAILDAILAISPNDVWAAGVSTTNGNGSGRPHAHTLIEHFNGANWFVVPSPDLRGGGFLHGLAGSGSNDVWAVGDGQGGLPLAEHWDGIRWRVVTMPAPARGVVMLQAVTEIAPNDVWAVGSNSDSTFTEHWNGLSWRIVPSPNITGEKNFLLAASHTGSRDVWAAGNSLGTSSMTTLVLHWNGARWTVEATKNPVQGGRSPSDSLAGILALAPTNVMAVGSNFTSSLVEAFCR